MSNTVGNVNRTLLAIQQSDIVPVTASRYNIGSQQFPYASIFADTVEAGTFVISSITVSTAIVSDLTATTALRIGYGGGNRFLATDSKGNVVEQPLLGVANQTQITGTPGSGTVSIGTVQDIATTSVPEFAAIKLNTIPTVLTTSYLLTWGLTGDVKSIEATSSGTASTAMLRDASGNTTVNELTVSATGVAINSAGNIVAANAKAYQLRDSGGTARSILSINGGNTVRISGANGPMIIGNDGTITGLQFATNSSVNTDFLYGTTRMLQINSNGASVGTSTGTNGLTFLNNTASYVPASLSIYEERTLVTLNYTGAWTASKTLIVSRIGKIVIATFVEAIETASSASTLSSGTDIPTRFRPSNNHHFPCRCIDSGSDQAMPALLLVQPTGVVIAYKDGSGASFTSGNTCGYRAISTSWQVV